MKKNTRDYLGDTAESILLACGFYYVIRILRNNIYFPMLEGINASDPVLGEVLTYLGHILFLLGLVVYFCVLRKDRVCLENFEAPNKKRDLYLIISGFLTGFLMNGAAIFAAVLHGDMNMVWRGCSPAMFILLFAAITIQASTEEFHYRLWCYNRIHAKAPLTYALAGSAISFAFAHCLNRGITIIAFLNLILIAILYCLSMHYFKSIWFACAHHAAWNITQNCIFGLPNSGHEAVLTIFQPTFTKASILYDPDFGVEGTWFSVLIQLAAVVLFAVLLLREKSLSR